MVVFPCANRDRAANVGTKSGMALISASIPQSVFPVTTTRSLDLSILQPISSRIRRKPMSPCRVSKGYIFSVVTFPPVAAAAAQK